MSLTDIPVAKNRKRFFVYFGALVFTILITLGVFAKNGWLPSTDPFTGKRTGWFGKELPKGAATSWNPFAAPPTPTPLPLSKELIYAGSRLLSVVDANAQEAPPADLAIWRPSTGTWWVMAGQYSQGATQGWGVSTDKPVPGDYDGDGKTDFSVFRPSTGEWFVLQSSDNSWGAVVAWGAESDVRVPADYDGDGKTDRAVWRASDGVWYIIKSSTQSAYYEGFGTTNDVPIPADYDGDGRADIAVWRNSNKTFYSVNSSNTSVQTVSSNIQPGTYDWKGVSSDYDGDGRADYAVYDKNGSNWYIRNSSSGSFSTTQWGNAGDEHVHNDYDGDGKTDIATWRPVDYPAGTLGKWYIRQSAFGNQPREVQWGIAGDIPVPAFYRR